MMNNRKGSATVILWVVIGVIVMLGLTFVMTATDLEMKKFFLPKYKELERDVWEESPSRVLGATQEINKRMLEYNEAETDEEKIAICAYLRNSYPDLTPEKIDDYKLRTFFEMCKYGG